MGLFFVAAMPASMILWSVVRYLRESPNARVAVSAIAMLELSWLHRPCYAVTPVMWRGLDGPDRLFDHRCAAELRALVLFVPHRPAGQLSHLPGARSLLMRSLNHFAIRNRRLQC